MRYFGFIHSVNQSNKQGQSNQLINQETNSNQSNWSNKTADQTSASPYSFAVFFVTVPKFPGFSLKETGHQYACFTITHCHLEWAEKLRYCSLIDLAGEVFWVSPPDTHCLYLQFSRILIIVVILMYTNILSVERKTTSTKNNIFEQPAPKFYKFASLFVNG